MNKLSDFIQCFGDVKDMFLAADKAGADKTRLILSYEYFGKDEKRLDAIEMILVDYVPRLRAALAGKHPRLLINAAQEDGLFEIRFELTGDEPGHFIIYNVPVYNALISEFARHSGEEVDVEFRAASAHLLEGIGFAYSFSQDTFEESIEGGFVDIDPSAALAQAALFNDGIFDPNKREC